MNTRTGAIIFGVVTIVAALFRLNSLNYDFGDARPDLIFYCGAYLFIWAVIYFRKLA
jgi:hypothetical protein